MNFNPHKFERPKPERLGEILLKHTSLKEEQLERALDEQREKGGLLGEILLKNNFILPHEIMKALCIQLGMTFVEDLKASDIDANLITFLPINYAKTKEVIPLYKAQDAMGEHLVVATADPFNPTISEDLQGGDPCRAVTPGRSAVATLPRQRRWPWRQVPRHPAGSARSPHGRP